MGYHVKSKADTRVIVGLSGGVDSAVAAYCLKKQGYQVEAAFMKNWEEDDTETYCSATQDRNDAAQICETLDIPFHTINFAAEYWDRVFTYFLETYRKGWTPNPDILCNQEIKFKAFLAYALQLGGDFIATGHYAATNMNNGLAELRMAADRNKDQTYFLYRLGQSALQRTLFPISDLLKPDVRRLAASLGFKNFDKKDSTGICFIGERRFKSFLQQYNPARPGLIQTPEGETLGEHDGIMYHTLGQRQGLKIGGVRAKEQRPWYVVGKDVEFNILYVAQQENHPWHLSTQLMAEESHWIAGTPPADSFRALARLRHRQPLIPCTVFILDPQTFRVQFDTPEAAVTPGQACVLYLDDLCLGGGTIAATNSPGGLVSRTV